MKKSVVQLALELIETPVNFADDTPRQVCGIKRKVGAELRLRTGLARFIAIDGDRQPRRNHMHVRRLALQRMKRFATSHDSSLTGCLPPQIPAVGSP